MGRILNTPTGIFIDGRTRPIELVGGPVFRAPECAAKAFGVPEVDVVDSATNGQPVVSNTATNLQFTWPTLAKVRREWPNYYTTTTAAMQAIPCTIHIRTPGRIKRNYRIDTRSITSTRYILGLSETEFDKIVHQAPGYQSFLPIYVRAITLHPGRTTATNPTPVAVQHGPYYDIYQGRRNIRVVPRKIGPFQHVSQIPDSILKEGVWH